MKNKIFISFLIFCLCPILLKAQEQDNPFLPKNLGEAVNSIYSEINPILSPDGKTLYFTRVDHPENRHGVKGSQDIWFTILQDDGTWAQAERMPNQVNLGRYNALLSVADNGKTLLLNGLYNKKGTYWKDRGFTIVKMTENGWGKPETVKISGYDNMSKGLNNSAFISSDGNSMILSFSTKRNSKKQDLYYSFMKANGSWSKPIFMEKLNSKFTDEAPSLSGDTRTIFFTSNRRSESNFDIYRSERFEDHSWVKWSTPALVTDTINSYYWESYFRTNKKGSMAYYCSTNGAIGGSDIFQIKLFEENPYIVVSGKIINSTTKSPMVSNVSYNVLANNQTIDSLFIDYNTSEYKAVLPLGKSYSFKAVADNHKSENEVVDASELLVLTEVKQDLYLEPYNFIQLSGNVLVKSTNSKVPMEANPVFYINGHKVDSVEIDGNTGSYSVKLPFGQNYELAVYTTTYEAIPEKLDLSDIKEFRQVIKNLYVDEQKTAIVVGKIFDKKTGKPFPKEIPVRIDVDDSTIKFANIDSLTREYRLELALGRSYTINAAAENYYPMTETVDVTNDKVKIRIYKDLYLVPVEVGQSVRLNNIFFETGKAVLMPESFVELDRVVKFLTDNPSVRIEIGGHTDNVGSAALNNSLSNKRAKAVADYIMLKGIPVNAITSKGYGFTKPVASNATKEGKQLNRRVEFVIIGK